MTQPRRNPIWALWLYTLLRFAVFGVLFGLLWVLGVRGLLGALIALLLSVPVSYVALSRPRRALATGMHDSLTTRRARTDALDAELSGDDTPTEGR